jgi:hypothetical protein
VAELPVNPAARKCRSVITVALIDMQPGRIMQWLGKMLEDLSPDSELSSTFGTVNGPKAPPRPIAPGWRAASGSKQIP